ncbi:MAG: hypothetical protein Q9211_000261 [Gyalolechia sp. 1 TL-2023]
MHGLKPPADGHVNRGTTLIIITSLLTALSTITTSIRIAVRSIKHQMGWDDLAISLATLLALVEIVFNGLEYRAGFGRHAFYLTTEQQQRSLGLEEQFGIIGANLALSRALYVYLRDERRLYRDKHSYPQQSDLAGEGSRHATGWWRRKHSSARSQDSVIPLEATAIKKTTDLSVTREPRGMSYEDARMPRLGGRPIFVEDQV